MAEKRLIDANALKVKAFADPYSGEGVVYVQDIDEAPTVDAVEVVHGRWIDRIDTDTQMHECSVCGARVVKGLYEYDNPNRYCYHCGAKMDLEVSDGKG